MRLNQIKLSGFKSFAEPTTFQLPGQRVGVVGPNGCGKSNIMDAVRWVLGESKASELRGESMQDVIFNGSGLRKPAGRASVELVFGNEDGRAGGAWGQYAEIAVKRVLTRDGGSTYYLNNQVVRRRDVQDVFMGTGLGPRAYAIIGQGTISRIIESRPEELRLFLEEAAGVSKYKERRRETEHRLRDTRDNLTRVDDILRELSGNLDKLERQADTAQRFHALQAAGTLKLHQLWFLKHRDAAAEAERVRLAVGEATLAQEARLAELRNTEARLEHTRQAHYAASDGLHAAQGELAQAALAVSRLEERIRYVVEGRQRAQARLADLQAQAAQWARARDEAQAESAQVAEQREGAEEQVAVLEAQAADAEAEAPQWEDALRSAQQRAQAQRSRAAQIQQQIQVLAAESRHVEEQLRSLRSRRDRLSAERSGLRAPDLEQLEGLRAQAVTAEAALDETQRRMAALAEALPEAEAHRRSAQTSLAEAASRESGLAARRDALQAVQAKVQTQTRLQPWLLKHGLDALLPLWKRLHVEPGWEAAVESALRERMLALEVGRLDTLAAFQTDAPPVKLSFFSASASDPAPPLAASEVSAAPVSGLVPMSSKLRLAEPALQQLLGHWLHGLWAAEDLGSALAARRSLGPNDLLMSREGHAVSALSVHFYAPDSEQAGLLARAQEIEQLTLDLAAQAELVGGLRTALVSREAECSGLAQQLAAARREASDAQTRLHELQFQVLRLTQQSEAALARREQLQDELGELDTQAEGLAERRAEGEARFEALDMDLATAQEEQASLEDDVTVAERRLGQAREQGRALERQVQEARFQTRAMATRLAELLRLERAAEQQIDAAEAAAAQEQADLAGFDDAAAQSGLQEALAERMGRERALADARHAYDDLAQQMRAEDEQRLSLEHSLAPLRERITALQLEAQAAQLGGSQYMEQLIAAEADLTLLAAGIAAGAVKLLGLQSEIDRIQREINSLGAVNLAALDELGAARERKAFLDAQNADLTDAIRTLENAIHKIDLETRDLLMATFNQVNEGFGRMFPRLFGGGQARLVMTGGEVLDSGVQVMAQPPGKKNATIHLLSGGEKALTAIALVFAIFLLNPAPFCLLDEVDAPLDDANTERYARLVSEMSQGTQFLFISHNKIAMEMAQQLIGVTMQEQGVSRIVAVDMEAAVGLAGLEG